MTKDLHSVLPLEFLGIEVANVRGRGKLTDSIGLRGKTKPKKKERKKKERTTGEKNKR